MFYNLRALCIRTPEMHTIYYILFNFNSTWILQDGTSFLSSIQTSPESIKEIWKKKQKKKNNF